MGSLCSSNNKNSEQAAKLIVQTKEGMPAQSNNTYTINPTPMTVTSVNISKPRLKPSKLDKNSIKSWIGSGEDVDAFIQPSSTTYLATDPNAAQPFNQNIEQVNVPTILRIIRLDTATADAEYPFGIRTEDDLLINYVTSAPSGLRFGTTDESNATPFHLQAVNADKNVCNFVVSYNVTNASTNDDNGIYYMSLNGTTIEGSKDNSTQLMITVANPKVYSVSEYEFDFTTANSNKTNITTGVEVSQQNVSCLYGGGSTQSAQINIEFELNLQSIFKLEFSNDQTLDGTFTFCPKIEVNYDNGDLQLTEDGLELNNFKDTFTYDSNENDYGILNSPVKYSSTVFVRNQLSRFFKAYLVMTRATVNIPFSATLYNDANGILTEIESTDANWTGYVYYNPTIRVTELDGTPFGGT